MGMIQKYRPLGIIPHDAFLRMTMGAQLASYHHHPSVKVAGPTAFQEMQAYLDKMHSGVDVAHSFEDRAGQIFDCIPIEQQPALRDSPAPLKQPPDLRTSARGQRPQPGPPALARPMDSAERDRHGNARQAPAGTIPVRRVGLTELTRFESLNTYFRKHPDSVRTRSPVPRPTVPDSNSGNNHRYAVGYQQVDNIGGHGFISIYAPQVDSNETFSLAQHWYSGGTGSSLQTVEVGWQVYPQMYGHAQPVLFIFWTADAYQTGGAYNLDKPGFVQVNSNVAIGGALGAVSTQGGTQAEVEIAAYFIDSAWWLYCNGLASDNAIGYYPGTLFGSGAMTRAADTIEFGGETVSGSPPSGDWGPMGSGAYAEQWWQQAAYQRNIWYYGSAGDSQWATLQIVEPVSRCYSFSGGFDVTNWGTYFFFGGPGGGDC